LSGVVRYSLVGSSASKFAIGPINGSIYTVAGLDREQVPLYNLIVMATDQAPNPKDRLSTTATVQVKLRDVNDNSPMFISPEMIEVREDAKLNSSIFTVQVQDLDEGTNSQITYRIVSQTTAGTFIINAQTGALSLKSALDRETIANHSVLIEAKDGGTPSRSSQQTLVVQVTDANDNAPIFTNAEYRKTVDEDVAVGTSVLRVLATDKDIGFNGAVRYFIVSGEGSNDFNLDMTSGVLRVQKMLDYERITSYKITIQAEDSSVENRLQANATIIISLNDVNDFVPVFDDSPYVTFVQEGMPDGLVPILTISARDEDSGYNGMVSYTMRDIAETSYSGIFDVNATSGQVFVKKTLDREATPMYILTIVAMDSGAPVQIGTATVTVFVKDVNDHSPVFDSNGPYLANVMENLAAETPVIIVSATDSDEGMNSQIIYNLADNMGSKFTIHPSTAQISTAVSLDREVDFMYTLTVIATDQGIPPRSASVQVIVMVGDDNDNAPEFDSSVYTSSMYDSSVTGDFVIGVTAVDQDLGKNGQVVYTLEGSNQALFRINSETGVVTLASPLPLSVTSFNFVVRASDLGKIPLNSSSSVTITVSKAPTTSKPRFNDSNTNLRIVENSVPGMSLTIVHATTATNNRITYYIVGGNVNNAFSINSDSGAITVSNNIDYEVIKSFDLWIEARDQGTTQLSSYQTLKIAVEDENDNPPVFSSSLYTASVSENCQVGTSVFTVTATDLDSNGKQGIVYSIKYGNENNTFQLDSLTGLLSTLNRVVDREKIAIYNLEIQAADVGTPPRTASTTVRVTIKDLNDNEPTFVGPRSVAVPEDLLVGSLVLQLSSVDQDIGENARAAYRIDTLDFPFVVNASTGTITNSQPLDAETTERYTLWVSVTDGSFIQRTTITIRILDVNDNPPQFKSSVLVYEFTELQQPSTKVTQLTAQDLDKSSPNNLFFFSLRRPSSQFELNSETGEIIVLEMMRFYAGQSVVDTMNDHILDVLVSDLGTPSLSSEATVNIKVIDANDHSPVFDKDKYFTAVPNNLNLSQNVIQVTCSDTLDYGVNAMVKYSLTKGTGLPYFIINNSTGVISSKASLPSAGSSPLLTLTVTCYDLGVPSLSTTTDVQLYITAPNGNAPRFNNNPFQKQVKEDVTIGFVIDTITATDSDSGLNGEIEYWITGGNSDGMFAIEVDTGKLVVNQTLDFETRVSYTVNITARDKALYSKEVTRAYDIQLIDVNDNKPLFDSEYYDAYIQENSVPSTPVLRAVATDADGTAANRIINYAIVGDATSKNSFQINANTGDIITGSTSFDYETRTLYTLLVMAYNPDQGNGEASYLKSVTTIYVHITGENEDSPRFLVRSYNFSISESAEMGKSVGKVTAMDKDHGVDGIVYYYLEAQSNLKGFLIEPLTGILRVSSRPDFESSPTVFLSVIAKNWGSVRGNDTDTCLVSISVIDANDPPEFTKAIYYANITENSPPNTFVTNVMAVDYDIRADFKQFKYKIMSGNVPERFQISSTGRIETSGLGVLDRETTSKYTLVVGAEDLNDPTIIGTATVVIELLDVNDNGPRFNPETLRLNVSENETAGIEVAVLRDYTVDADLPPNQGPYRYKFTLGSWSDYFSFNELTGRIETTKVLNRDLTPQFVIPVVVSDGGTPTMTSTLTFTIIVTDINDAQPRPRPLTVLVNLLENQRLSGKIADVRPLDSDLSDPFRCRILSGDAANFVINNNNCDLEALQLTSADTYKLRVQGTDDKYPSVEYDVTVNVQLLTNDSLISSVVMELRNEKASTFLEKKYTLFKKAVEDVFGVYVTCRIYSVKESGSNLYVFMFANDNHNRLLSSSDMIRGLNSSKSIVETASSVSIQNVALVRCSSGSCKNGGVCSTVVVLQKEITIIDSPSWVMTSWSPDPAISCFCMPAFTGPLCEDSQKPCGSDYCNHGGTCNNNVCSCPNNWQGPFCQIDVDECSLAPECKNGATCHNIDGSYECICTPGYQGKFCDTPNFCASQPCSPHGTCEELIDTYHCRCNYGYHGPTCQLSSMSFGEGSYAVFPSVDNYHTFNISLYFATVSSNALLMFSPVSIGQLRQGFIAVEVVNSQVKVSFLLDPPTDAQDSAVITLSTTAIVNTGYWYRLEFTKVTWTANLIVQKCPDQTCDSCVDKRKECYNETNFALQNLQLTGQYISIGGIKNFKDITDQKGAVSTHDFVGCVHSVSINNRPFGGSSLVSGSDSGASMPIESLNVSSSCPRQQATSMCVNLDCHDGTCVDKWSEVTCKCSSKYMDDTCSSVRQPFTLGNNAKVKYTLHQSFVRDATLAALRARRRRGVAESALVLRLRTVQNKGVVFSSSTDTSSCLLWFDEVGLHFLLKSPDAVSDPITLTDVSIGDGSWHNVTVSRFGTTYTLDFDEQKSQTKVFGETYDFDSLRLMEMAIGGSAVVPANQEIQGFQGCLSQFLINGELMQLNGTSDKYLITTEGGVDGTCLALCSNSPCGGNNKCTPDGEKFKCMYMAEESAGLETGIIVVIVFFSILLCAIVVVFVLFRTRRDLFHRCVRSKKKSPSIGSSSSHGKVLDNMITSGGINSRYALNPSEEEMIIRNHIAENLNGSKGSSLSARPDLIGSNFSDQPLHLSDGTVIMETGVMNNLLGEEDAPEHYDFENASSIAPSDIAPSEVIRHYKDFRNGTHHHHHHHHQQLQPSPLNNQLFNKYRDSPVSGSNYRAGPNASHVRQSPLSLSGSALSVPHNGSQVLLPTGGRPSSALAALNQAEGSRSRMSPLTQLNVRSPRTLPQNYNTNNLSRSNSIGSHHSHSSSSSATGHLIPPVHSQHKLTNNKSLSLARGSNPKGLTVEDVNRLNARPDLTDPLSLLEVGSSSVDGRPKVNHHILPQEPVLDSSLLLEAPDSSSSDSGANDSFTCSEFEYDNDNVRTRLDLDPKKMIFSKLTEVENESDDHHHPPQHQKMNSDGFVSNGDSFTSTNPSSSSLGSPSTPNHQYLISNQYDFDALLNWAPNFDKFVGVFRDIAQLPDTGGHKNVTDHDYEEYV
ncbi:cadherin-related tumor suppressor, partial [Biomphalaria glabrata]